jgi:hypothetical protein
MKVVGALSKDTEKGRRLNELGIAYYEAEKAGQTEKAREILGEGYGLVIEEYERLAYHDARKAVPSTVEAEGSMFWPIQAEDVADAYLDSIVEAFEKYDPNKGMLFTSWAHLKRTQALAKLLRSSKMTAHLINEVPMSALQREHDDGEGDDDIDGVTAAERITEVSAPGVSVEDMVLDDMFAPHVDELIEYLYDSTNDRGRKVMDELKKKPEFGRKRSRTDNDVAKSLGLHNFVVRRTTNRIRDSYEIERFGPVTDYVRKSAGLAFRREYTKPVAP